MAGDYTIAGDVGEAEAISELRRSGYTVSVPFDDSAPYDLIAEKDTELTTIQVKSCSCGDGETSQFYIKSDANNRGYGERVDTFILYDFKYDKIFAIERERAPSTHITVRIQEETSSRGPVSFDTVF
jgi:hypothetical protein